MLSWQAQLQGMIWLGALTAAAMSLGMAFTITMAATIAYAGKSLSLKATAIAPGTILWLERILETSAALALLILGLLFLSAALY